MVLDEVQQHLCQDPHRTLQLQTIAERLSNEFDGRVLLVCTGQQALSDVPNLQKLLGRFPVQVALGEADIDAVIRQTVLRKKPGAEPVIADMLARHAGEISRHLRGSPLAHRREDNETAPLDWPLLPSRRRVWELILAELDRTGLGGTLRGQLRTTLDAARRFANRPLGHAVPADFLYGRFAEEAFNAGLLPGEARNRIEKLRGGSGDDPLKARILMLVYMLGRILGDADRHGVRPRAETIADLLIEDLAGEPELRRKVPELLLALRDEGAVIEVGGDWRLQTKESAEWEQAFRTALKEKEADEAGIAALRQPMLARALADTLPGTGWIPHGRSGTKRNIHHLAPTEKAPADGVVLRRHHGYESDIAQVEKEIAAAPPTDATVHLLVPRHRAEELRQALVQQAAARSVIDLRGVPDTTEGKEARAAMETREASARRRAEEISREAVAKARVVQAGGSVVPGPLASAVKTAAANALARLYPQFDEADHPGWEEVFDRAHRKKEPDAIKAVDHQGSPETHPVCKAILQHLGPGRKGSEIRAHFEAQPYGWPKDAIDGALTVLANAGLVKVTGEDGKDAALTDFPRQRQKIGLCTFRPESTVVTVGQRVAVRGLLDAAGVPFEKEREHLALSALLDRLEAAAREAGGEPPAPAAPAVPGIADLRQRSGNDLLVALAGRAAEKTALDTWRAAAKTREERMPRWRLAERLVAHGAVEQQAALDAVRTGRLLLAEPDPVPPIVQGAADALRGKLNAAWQAWQAAWAQAEARLNADGCWQRLSPDQRRAIREQVGLLPVEEPEVARPEDIAAALRARGLAAWGDLAKALPARVDEALAEAAALLEPKARTLVLPGRLLRTETELDEWLDDLRARVMAALTEGPIIPKV